MFNNINLFLLLTFLITPVFEALYFLKLCPSISLLRAVKTLMSIFNNCQSYTKLNLKFKSLMYSIILRYSTWHWNRWGIFWLHQYPVGLFSYWLHSSATLTYRDARIGKLRYRTPIHGSYYAWKMRGGPRSHCFPLCMSN